MVGNVVDFPLFIGTTLFALEAVGVVSHHVDYFTTTFLWDTTLPNSPRLFDP
jgi:hypothetical protein